MNNTDQERTQEAIQEGLHFRQSDMLTAAEAAKLINRSARAVRGWIADGDLPATGKVGHRQIRRQDLVQTLIAKGYYDEARAVSAIETAWGEQADAAPARVGLQPQPAPALPAPDRAGELAVEALVDDLADKRERLDTLAQENRALWMAVIALVTEAEMAAAQHERPAPPWWKRLLGGES